jgi:AAHS family 3-hydroxyphenylpropionic acid transporter
VQAFGWPAIFIVGGVLPFVMIPVLALWLPESTRIRVTRGNPVIALFRDRLASSTALLWAMNFLSLLAVYLILLLTPSILHMTGRLQQWPVLPAAVALLVPVTHTSRKSRRHMPRAPNPSARRTSKKH